MFAPTPVSAPAPGAAADQTSRATDIDTDTQPHAQPPLFSDRSSEARSTDNNTAVNFPTITPSDYQTDDEFRNMFTYLMFGELTGNTRVDKTTLIMADRYLIDNDDLLYRICLLYTSDAADE